MILLLLVSCLWGVDLKRKQKKRFCWVSLEMSFKHWRDIMVHDTLHILYFHNLFLWFSILILGNFSSPESDAGTTALFLKLTDDRGRKWQREPCSFTWTANFQTDTMKFSHWRFFFFSTKKKKKKRFKGLFKDDSCTLATKQKVTDSRRCFTSLLDQPS